MATETITFAVSAKQKQAIEELAEANGYTTSNLTAALVAAGVDSMKTSDREIGAFLDEYAEDRTVGRPKDHSIYHAFDLD